MCIKRKINKKKTFFLMLRVPVILYFSWALEDFCQRVLSIFFYIRHVFTHTILFFLYIFVLWFCSSELQTTKCKKQQNKKNFSSCQILIVWEKKRKIRYIINKIYEKKITRFYIFLIPHTCLRFQCLLCLPIFLFCS